MIEEFVKSLKRYLATKEGLDEIATWLDRNARQMCELEGGVEKRCIPSFLPDLRGNIWLVYTDKVLSDIQFEAKT